MNLIQRYNSNQIYGNLISCSFLLSFILLLCNFLLLPIQISESSQIVNARENAICNIISDCTTNTNFMSGIDLSYNLYKISDYEKESKAGQEVYQSNKCMDDASCKNSAIMNKLDSNKDVIGDKTDSNRVIIQSNECSDNQICVNDAKILDYAFLSKESQRIIQHCDTSSGPTCLNDNPITIDTDALRKAMLEYVDDEDQEKNK